MYPSFKYRNWSKQTHLHILTQILFTCRPFSPDVTLGLLECWENVGLPRSKVQVAKTYDILQLSTTEKSIDTENMEEYVPHFKAKQHIS